MPTAKILSAVIYCRISRDPEGEGIKVERQEQICRELAVRHGLPLIDVYKDNDIGASDQTHKKKVRHDFQRMERRKSEVSRLSRIQPNPVLAGSA